MTDSVPCAGSDVYVDERIFDGLAYCPGCQQRIPVRPDYGSHRYQPHMRALPVNAKADALWVPDTKGEAA